MSRPISDINNDSYEAIMAMARVKMAMNNHKAGIESLSCEALVALLKDEVDELVEALKSIESGNYMHVIEESADCVNYLMAIASKSITKYRTRK